LPVVPDVEYEQRVFRIHLFDWTFNRKIEQRLKINFAPAASTFAAVASEFLQLYFRA
jgi:hypothetical protein